MEAKKVGQFNSYIHGKCYKVQVRNTYFLSPVEQYNAYLKGTGNKRFMTCVGDARYKAIEECIINKVLPNIRRYGKKKISSYGLKHAIENEVGGYVSNETVKYIMAVHRAPDRKSVV